MDAKLWHTPGWPGDLTALFAGVLVTLSLAPYNIWPLGVLAALVLANLCSGLTPRRTLLRAFVFGLGMYGSGASWVYVSIHDYGFTGPVLATILTSIFVLGLALVFALPFYLYGRFLSHNRWSALFGFPAIWVLGEWTRTWFLTGFPWLFLGYGHHDTWLAGWAPVTGVLGLSYLAIFTGMALGNGFYQLTLCLDRTTHPPCSKWPTITVLAATAAFWLGGWAISDYTWTRRLPEAQSLAVIQPAIPQQMKWQPGRRGYISQTLRDLASPHWGADLMVWPEAAIPLLYNDAEILREEFNLRAEASDTALLSGILYDNREERRYYNSIIGLGEADGVYFKQRLVPFGEYVPLEKWLRGLIAFFDLPNSVIHPGPKGQQLLRAHDYRVATSICYEVVYPGLTAEYAAAAQVLVTISNDAWFGDSIGPLQHFEMAQMRALENGRFMIRATNTGISGLIDEKGRVLAVTPQFEQAVLTGTFYLTEGVTPFGRTGSWPVVIFCLALALAFPLHRRLTR